MNKGKVPQLRFPGFDGEWEKKKLGDVGKIKMCKRIFSNETSESGDIPFYKIGTFGREADAYITKELYLDYKSRFSFPKIGEILMSASGTLGRTVVYDGKPAYFQDSNIVWIENNEEVITNSFLFYIYQIVRYDSEGGTIQRLYNSIISNTKFNRPTLPEQQKIASFLSAVDEKIQQLSRKKELLEQYKKGVMQQLFSGKLRFKDESGNEYPDWEEKKLGKVCDVRDGTHDSPKYVEKGFAFITSKNLLKDGSIDFDNVSFINEIDYNKVNQRSKVNINDILFGMIGTIGNPVLVKSEGFAIKNVALIKEKKDLLNPFLIHFLKGDSINQQFFKQNTGGTQKFLSLSVIRNLAVIVPTIPEQQKIANFLSSIDTKIENTKDELEKTQGFKKGLLQQLFV